MIRTSSIALLIIILSVGSASAQSKDDAALFDATLAKFSAESTRSHHAAPTYLVFNQTAIVLEWHLGFVSKHLPKQLVDALLVYNSVPQSIESYSPPSPFRLSSARTLGPVLQTAEPGLARAHYYNWNLLHTQFPDAAGILEFASPAYSPDGSTALVYFWTGCGGQCANGYVYVLEKSDGTWRVVQTFSPWEA
jgi:hypothetical protein